MNPGTALKPYINLPSDLLRADLAAGVNKPAFSYKQTSVAKYPKTPPAPLGTVTGPGGKYTFFLDGSAK